VLLFASLREAASAPEISIEVPPGGTISDVLERLREALPNHAGLLDRCAFAVNAEYVDRDAGVHRNDEIAVIPPVSGGAQT
jgi:molybdopterin converting factor subunit 1